MIKKADLVHRRLLLINLIIYCTLMFPAENLIINPNLDETKNGKTPSEWNASFYKEFQSAGRFEYRKIDGQDYFFCIGEEDKTGAQVFTAPINVETKAVYIFDLEYYASGDIY